MGQQSYQSSDRSFKKLISLAIADGHVLVIGETMPLWPSIEYRGSAKKFLLDLVTLLNVHPERMTTESCKEAIANSANGVIVWIKNAHRLPLGLRFWLVESGLKLIFQCPKHPQKDVFLEAIAIEAPSLSFTEISQILQSEAEKIGLQLSAKRLHELSLVCTSAASAKVMVRREKLGLDHDFRSLPGDYLDISPLLFAVFAGLGILRYVGLGFNDKTLYIVGGISVMVGLMVKYLSRFGR